MAVSRETGAPTLAAAAARQREAKKRGVRADPLVEAVLERFPGAEIVARDQAAARPMRLPELEAGDPEMPPDDPEDER